MRRYGYSTYIEWGVSDKPYCNCEISWAHKEQLDQDGFNYVSKNGSEGRNFFISKDLEEAIIKAKFNPFIIKFYNLNKEEMFKVKDILSKYRWDSVKGLIRK